jgi:hypothetical protein
MRRSHRDVPDEGGDGWSASGEGHGVFGQETR